MPVLSRLSAGLALALALALAACGAPSAPASPADAVVETTGLIYDDLPGFFDCVRESGGVLIAAHRGGPGPGHPENAIETMQYGLDNGLHVFEVDVATSQDGVMFLMHDDTLGRTTTASGRVASTNWAEIANQSLKDPTGRVTRMTPPKLTDALLWARRNGAILELDKKPTTSWRDMIAAVRAANAEDHVILITYSRAAAGRVHKIAPDLMITAGVGGRDALERLQDEGVQLDRLIGWTGTRIPRPGIWARMNQVGVEAAFGTLGRPGERLDDKYLSDGDAAEYVNFARQGLVLLATDSAREIAGLIEQDNRAVETCGQSSNP